MAIILKHASAASSKIIWIVSFFVFWNLMFAVSQDSPILWFWVNNCRIRPGSWSPGSRKYYNLLDALSRNTIQVYPKCWAAILLTHDNVGIWNIRSEIWERQYLGQQLYFSLQSPVRSLRDEYNPLPGTPLCGKVKGLPEPPPYTIWEPPYIRRPKV